MKKKALLIPLIVIGAILLLAAGYAAIILTGNEISTVRCIVTENESLYMVYDKSPVSLSFDSDNDLETGDLILVVHQSTFAESYPESTRAYFIMRLGKGSEEDVPQEAIDVLIETGNMGTAQIAMSDYDTYAFAESVDPITPAIRLSTTDRTAQFTYSGFSSYVGIGKYTLTEDTLTIRTDDGVNTYVFRVEGDTFVFDAKNSSEIPEYRYSGDSYETESPVPDGAVFKKVLPIDNSVMEETK